MEMLFLLIQLQQHQAMEMHGDAGSDARAVTTEQFIAERPHQPILRLAHVGSRKPANLRRPSAMESQHAGRTAFAGQCATGIALSAKPAVEVA